MPKEKVPLILTRVYKNTAIQTIEVGGNELIYSFAGTRSIQMNGLSLWLSMCHNTSYFHGLKQHSRPVLWFGLEIDLWT